ncbi:hypothetical protein SAMN05421736_11211 [Evansella caseinilytica]|uniref:Enterobactin esterase n=1 Tax=Evansella caseinilytica TaxID=1503961 RepID=A0A1H3SSG9_9BACI|nr:alpha/beta hydrolase [Evansella caseinilytica]SDZ41043.1 hypothetical protein SAMN05421736_11211 [Evansella caseinilytica]
MVWEGMLKDEKSSSMYTITGTEQQQIVSGLNREYHIFISKPNVEPPATGYPVIYYLDGNSVFGTVVEAMRIQSAKPEKTGVVPAVIVGIGYPTDSPFSPARFYDYTITRGEIPMRSKPDGTAWPDQGGAEEFLSFIEEELKPKIHRTYPTDPSKQALFGHSLGGLFVLYALFAKPAAFRTYIAGSPSIHLNERSILEKETMFRNQLEKQTICADLLIGIGELENNHKSNIGNYAKKMVGRLSNYENRGLKVNFIEFAEEGHSSVLPPLVNRSLRYSCETWNRSFQDRQA